MRATGPPLGTALFSQRRLVFLRPLLLLRRIPETPVGEPFHLRFGMFPLQLHEGRHELIPLPRAKRGSLLADQDGPERVTWGHAISLTRRSQSGLDGERLWLSALVPERPGKPENRELHDEHKADRGSPAAPCPERDR